MQGHSKRTPWMCVEENRWFPLRPGDRKAKKQRVSFPLGEARYQLGYALNALRGVRKTLTRLSGESV